MNRFVVAKIPPSGIERNLYMTKFLIRLKTKPSVILEVMKGWVLELAESCCRKLLLSIKQEEY